MLDPVFGYLIVIASALLFAFAASHKLRSLERFAQLFEAYHVMPQMCSRRLAPIIPGLELAIALLLASSASRRWGILAAIGLLIAYASAVAVNLARGRRELDCGCGAAGLRRSIASWMVWRNLLLVVALALAGLPWSSRPCGAVDALTIVCGVAAVAALYAAVDRLLGDVAPKAVALSRPS